MIRYQLILWSSLFTFFILESSLIPLLLPHAWQVDVRVHFHLLLTGILFLAVFKNRHYALLTGIAFGFLQDFIFFGHMLGVNAFAMGLAGYVTGLLFTYWRMALIPTLSAVVVGVLAYEFVLYFLYTIFRVVQIPFQWILLHQVLPSTIATILFALAIYVPARKLLERLTPPKEEDQD